MEYTRLLKNTGRPYMQGDDVREVQELLKQKGFNPGGIDGLYGPKTKKAVKAYQKAKGLKRDGIVGVITWGSLHAMDAVPDPEPEPIAETPIRRFLNWIILQIGCLYVWGAQGQEMTPALIKKLENSDKNYRRALARYEQHAAQGKTLVAYDCSGLIIKYLLDNGLISYDTTANGIYFNFCLAVARTNLQAGDLVFKKYRTRNEMYHVGVYMGDGTVVHAKGRDVGVVRESISATGWNRFGRLKVFADADGEVAYSRSLKRIVPNMQGDDVRAVQTALLDAGFDPKGIDGLYGKNTVKAVKAYQKAKGLEVDGIVGPITWASLFE